MLPLFVFCHKKESMLICASVLIRMQLIKELVLSVISFNVLHTFYQFNASHSMRTFTNTSNVWKTTPNNSFRKLNDVKPSLKRRKKLIFTKMKWDRTTCSLSLLSKQVHLYIVHCSLVCNIVFFSSYICDVIRQTSIHVVCVFRRRFAIFLSKHSKMHVFVHKFVSMLHGDSINEIPSTSCCIHKKSTVFSAQVLARNDSKPFDCASNTFVYHLISIWTAIVVHCFITPDT